MPAGIPGAAPSISMGAVIRNDTDRIAYRTRVTFDALTADGTSAFAGTAAHYRIIEVPLLAPGASAAVGQSLAATTPDTPTEITVTTAVSGWLPAGTLTAVTAAVVPGKNTRADDGALTLTLTASSTNCQTLTARSITFALRDTTGTIIGGGTDAIAHAPACASGTTEPTAPTTTDLDTTDITALCDLTPAPRTGRTDDPFN